MICLRGPTMPRALRHGWRRRNISRSPARTLPTAWYGREGRRGAPKRGGIVRVNFARPPTFVTAPTTANDAEDNDTADGAGQADHKRFVIIDPALDFFGDRGAAAHSLSRISVFEDDVMGLTSLRWSMCRLQCRGCHPRSSVAGHSKCCEGTRDLHSSSYSWSYHTRTCRYLVCSCP